MKSKYTVQMANPEQTPANYIKSVPAEQKEAFLRLREIILENISEGFEETISYGLLSYTVPHSIYPEGYHCAPENPLPFMTLASRKNSINLSHMGLYADPVLLEWFRTHYEKEAKRKIDMGKSCIRFKYMDDIPYNLIAQLCKKMTLTQWIKIYTSSIKK